MYDYFDPVRLEHTEDQIHKLHNDDVFTHYHNSADEINNNLKARPSWNHGDPDPGMHEWEAKMRA